MRNYSILLWFSFVLFSINTKAQNITSCFEVSEINLYGNSVYISHSIGQPVLELEIRDLKTVSTNQTNVFNPTIYPNPSANHIHISCTHCTSTYTLIIRDKLGKLIFSKPDFTIDQTIDISNIHAGYYFLTLIDSSSNIQQTSKFIKIN